jgi:hypothetical protein
MLIGEQDLGELIQIGGVEQFAVLKRGDQPGCDPVPRRQVQIINATKAGGSSLVPVTPASSSTASWWPVLRPHPHGEANSRRHSSSASPSAASPSNASSPPRSITGSVGVLADVADSPPPRRRGAAAAGRLCAAMPEQETIDHVLEVFLLDQRLRLSDRTYRNYADVIRLLRDSLNTYAYSSLSSADAKRWQKAFDAGDEEAFCHLFGPQEIPPHLGEFLGYFMVRKVIAGQELLKAAGTVTGKLVRWLEKDAYIEPDVAAIAGERARESSRTLPAAERLGSLLQDVAARAPDVDVDDVDDEDWVEEQLMISQIEPGRIWFEGDVGPFEVPKRASDLAQPGWMVFIVAARVKKRWHLLEAGSVYP